MDDNEFHPKNVLPEKEYKRFQGALDGLRNLGDKPPTQAVGVHGFAAFESKPAAPTGIYWSALVELPPFQMFAVEKAKRAPGEVTQWLPGWLQSEVERFGEQAVFDSYAQWHSDKGYWPAETPMGLVKE